MAILRERTTWKKPPVARADRIDQLSADQRVNVRKAMDVLRAKHGDWKQLARAMGVGRRVLMRALSGPGKPGAGLALRASRLAGVPIDDVLSGALAKAWVCPTCGRGAD